MAGKFSYPTGKEGAELLVYDPGIISNAPSEILKSFCGIGNPFSLGAIPPGATVLDFGCGAGFDLYVASRYVGPNGRVCGVDLTKEMAQLANENLRLARLTNYEIKQTDSEAIPYPDNSFDVIISNGVINLCPDKTSCFNELFHVLKPRGRMQFADIVLESQLPPQLASSPETWSQ